MAYIYKKKIGSRTYYYLRASQRRGTRLITKDLAYLGSSLSEVRKNLAKLPLKIIRKAHKTIKRFLETNTYLEMAKKSKIKYSLYLQKDLLEQIEACRLHWQKRFKKLHKKTKQDYINKFIIDFSFNTTSIEGNTINLDETMKLLREKITPKNKTLREIYDIQNTEHTFQEIINKPPIVSHKTIVEIHKELMNNIDDRIGYRNADVHVIRARFEATPAEYVKTDIDILIKWSEKNKQKFHPFVLGSIFHHKFEKIHPFFDGNGRTGRMLINAVLLKFGYPPIIIRKKNRTQYLDTLGRADTAKLNEAPVNSYKKFIEFLATEYIENYWNNFL